jgi:UDP-4-amino-4-deoxy-L-arabinose-oxoglutarate aminotransferase
MSDAPFIPFCRPTIEDDEIEAVVATLRSGWITSGPRVVEFEKAFAAYAGTPDAVALNSATAGLHVLLAAMGVGPGTEVVTTSMTWPSTVNVIELLGATPVFADIHEDTLQIDAADVRRRITPRTRAVVPVHFAGQPSDLDALAAAVEGTGAAIVEDAAHAVGTEYRGRRIGARRHPAVFSFHPIKNITTGEGGMITCHDAELAARLRVLRFHGVSKDAWSRYGRSGSSRYEVVEPGWKYNMLDLQAALGLRQLAKFERFNAARARLAARYDAALSEIDGIRIPGRVPWPSVHAWHLYVIQVDTARSGIERDALIAALAAEGVGAGLHFTPVHMHSWYREKYGFAAGSLPVTERVGERILSLPLYPLLSDADQDRVVDAVRRILAREAARA